jgi:hypothetical protein
MIAAIDRLQSQYKRAGRLAETEAASPAQVVSPQRPRDQQRRTPDRARSPRPIQA